MGVIYGVFNHTRKEFVQPAELPVEGSDPVSFPYSSFIVNLLVNSWRHEHVVILDDSGDIQCDWDLSNKYKDRSVELWNEFVTLYSGVLPGLLKV